MLSTIMLFGAVYCAIGFVTGVYVVCTGWAEYPIVTVIVVTVIGLPLFLCRGSGWLLAFLPGRVGKAGEWMVDFYEFVWDGLGVA